MLVAGHDDGLHDLRVALRRLRTLLRAFRPLVEDSLKRKTLRALRTLARATSDARDAEVACAWVSSQADIPPRAQPGVREIARRFAEERDAARAAIRERLDDELPSLVNRLTKQLSAYAEMQSLNAPVVAPTFGEVAGAVIERQRSRLARALERVKTLSDVDEAHRARIAAKRLRYVLEPLHQAPHACEPLERLIELQDVLGDARDAHQLWRRFARETGELGARDARVKTGLLELARRARKEERRAFAVFRREWGVDNAAGILESIRPR
jgi:CHAD domain-containing protein